MIREDPPANPGGRRLSELHADDLAKVQTEPGVWFRLIDHSANRSPVQQAHNAMKRLRAQTDGYEFRQAGGKVYVRWIGEGA